MYFLRTSLLLSEELIRMIHNIMREIEYSFRTLKTDLDLRPIYHKKDPSSMAHLHLGLLAYRVVNTKRNNPYYEDAEIGFDGFSKPLR